MRHLLRFLDPPLRSAPAPFHLEVCGSSFPITVRRNERARRMTLRLARDGEGAVLTLPNRVSRNEAQAFLVRSRDWLEGQLEKQAPRVALQPGAEIPFRGRTYSLAATGRLRGFVTVDEANSLIHVPGLDGALKRRLLEFLKSEARQDLHRASEHYARKLGVTVRRIAIRDQKSRWGSCTSNGDLAYSWRLVLAPPHVLDYVAAHEVAHLREMNHSPRFWRHVLTHCPHAKDAKTWLRAHGHELHRFV